MQLFLYGILVEYVPECMFLVHFQSQYERQWSVYSSHWWSVMSNTCLQNDATDLKFLSVNTNPNSSGSTTLSSREWESMLGIQLFACMCISVTTTVLSTFGFGFACGFGLALALALALTLFLRLIDALCHIFLQGFQSILRCESSIRSARLSN